MLLAAPAAASCAWPPDLTSTLLGPMLTVRRSISTKRPDSGRFDQSEFAVTWNSTIQPSPLRDAVTRGVPSASLAHTCDSVATVGSASTWRFTLTSSGTASPRKGLEGSKPASGCGVLQDRDPPSDRPPRR